MRPWWCNWQGAFGARHWHTRSTSARHRIRHGIRHMPIDSARVSKADGSQSLEAPAERGAVYRRAAEEFEQRVFLSTLNDIRNFCEAYGIEEPRSKSRASGIPRAAPLVADRRDRYGVHRSGQALAEWHGRIVQREVPERMSIPRVVSESDGGQDRDRTLAATLQRRTSSHESRRPHPAEFKKQMGTTHGWLGESLTGVILQ